MVIPDSRTIVFGTAAQQTRYRYCPIPSLPSSFKDADEMVPDTPPFEEPVNRFAAALRARRSSA